MYNARETNVFKRIDNQVEIKYDEEKQKFLRQL
jgi:hypothetical protein